MPDKTVGDVSPRVRGASGFRRVDDEREERRGLARVAFDRSESGRAPEGLAIFAQVLRFERRARAVLEQRRHAALRRQAILRADKLRERQAQQLVRRVAEQPSQALVRSQEPAGDIELADAKTLLGKQRAHHRDAATLQRILGFPRHLAGV